MKETIHVHACQCCGDHARESAAEGDDIRTTYTVDAFQLAECERCNLLACHSCLAERDCCERASEKNIGEC